MEISANFVLNRTFPDTSQPGFEVREYSIPLAISAYLQNTADQSNNTPPPELNAGLAEIAQRVNESVDSLGTIHFDQEQNLELSVSQPITMITMQSRRYIYDHQTTQPGTNIYTRDEQTPRTFSIFDSRQRPDIRQDFGDLFRPNGNNRMPTFSYQFEQAEDARDARSPSSTTIKKTISIDYGLALPTNAKIALLSNESLNTCPICLSQIKLHEDIFTPLCFHILHSYCWKMCPTKNKCAVCRQEINVC